MAAVFDNSKTRNRFICFRPMMFLFSQIARSLLILKIKAHLFIKCQCRRSSFSHGKSLVHQKNSVWLQPYSSQMSAWYRTDSMPKVKCVNCYIRLLSCLWLRFHCPSLWAHAKPPGTSFQIVDDSEMLSSPSRCRRQLITKAGLWHAILTAEDHRVFPFQKKRFLSLWDFSYFMTISISVPFVFVLLASVSNTFCPSLQKSESST